MATSHKARVFSFRKAGSPVLDPGDVERRASSVMPALPTGTTFIIRRTEQGVEHLLVTDDQPQLHSPAFDIAQAVHAEVVEVDEAPNLMGVNRIAQLYYGRNSRVQPATAAGADVATTATIMAQSLGPGEWVAMSMRHPSKREARLWHKWLSDGHGVKNNPTLGANSQVAQVWGGTNQGEATDRVLSLASSLAGFVVAASAKPVTGMRAMRSWFTGGALLVALGVVAAFMADKIPELEVLSYNKWAMLGGVALIVYGLLAAGVIPGYTAPGKWRTLRTQLLWGRVPVAAKRVGTVKPPRPARVDPETREIVPASEGEYPLSDTSFMLAAIHLLNLLVPHVGSFGRIGSTAHRDAPVELTNPDVGPQIGVSAGVPTYLSWGDLWSGTFLIGRPGSGKTALMEWLWGESCKQVAGGKQITPIGFDTKGDGEVSRQMTAWGAEHNVAVLQFHVADQNAAQAIDLFPAIGSAYQQARRIVDTFVYLYGDVSVGPRSKDTLSRVLHAALCVTPELVHSMPGADNQIGADRSPFYYANVLLGGFGDPAGQALADRIATVASQDGANPELVEASQGLAPLYGGGATPAKRRDLVEAPRNKVAALLGMEHWWSAPNKVGWSELLDTHQPVVVNTGIAPNGHQPGDQQIVEDMGSLLLYSLKLAIQEHCFGWQAQGRAVRIFSDEVKAVAAVSPEVVKWMRSDGRSFGVEAMFATQQPRQLPVEVRQEVMTFGNLIVFTQNDTDTATEVAKNLALDGSEWTAQDVVTLPRYHAIVQSSFQQTRQPPFTVEVPNFRELRETTTAEGTTSPLGPMGSVPLTTCEIMPGLELSFILPPEWQEVTLPGRVFATTPAGESGQGSVSVSVAPQTPTSAEKLLHDTYNTFTTLPNFQLISVDTKGVSGNCSGSLSCTFTNQDGEEEHISVLILYIAGKRIDIVGTASAAHTGSVAHIAAIMDSTQVGS